MKYHKQEHLYAPEIGMKGSCYPTVLACLLDLELHDVPYFHLFYWTTGEKRNLNKVFRNRYLDNKPEEECQENQRCNYHHAISLADGLWDIVLKTWLAAQGYEETFVKEDSQLDTSMPYLVSGISVRGIEHVVIYQGGKMIHDPHPSNDGLVKPKEHYPYSYLKKI